MDVVFLGPMRIPIPSEKGAVEDIIWQLARRVNADERAWIFNPILPRHNKIRSISATCELIPWSWGKAKVVIHSHNPYASLALTRLSGVGNHLVTLHYPPWISDRAVENRIFIRLLKTLDLFGVRITVPNFYIRDWLIRRGIRAKYLANGVDTDTFNPGFRDEALRSRLLGKNADLLLVNLGRVDDTKNQLMLLKSFREILRINPRVRLVLIGPKSGSFQASGGSTYASQVQSFIDTKGLSDNILWLGEVATKEEVARTLASCDIYVHPSKIEAAPLAILEAMASGLPIVAFDLPWYRGYLVDGSNSILCAYSIDALTECLLAAIGMNVDNGVRNKQYELAKRFSWDVLIAEYKRCYRTE